MSGWLRKLAELEESGTPAALVTVVRCQGSTPAAPGAKMIVLADGTFSGHRRRRAPRAARPRRRARVPRVGRGEDASGIRWARPPGSAAAASSRSSSTSSHAGPRLYLFGAGHVAQALCRVLAGTPFVVHAIDEREEWSGALPVEVRRHAAPWDVFAREAEWSAERTYVAIMTHRHDTDEAIVADVVGRPARYLGLIGSPTKWRRFRDRLESRGVAQEALDRIKCPIGLDVGGKSPQEVAISIAAELLGVHHGRAAAR